jgi:transposase InsO family protein
MRLDNGRACLNGSLTVPYNVKSILWARQSVSSGQYRTARRVRRPLTSEVRELTENWRSEYNEERPHSSLGDMPPVIFARKKLAGNPHWRRY